MRKKYESTLSILNVPSNDLTNIFQLFKMALSHNNFKTGCKNNFTLQYNKWRHRK